MKLLDDWKRVVKKAWSFRLALLSAVLGGAEVVIQFWRPDGISPGAFAAVAALVSIASALSRIVAQPKAYKHD